MNKPITPNKFATDTWSMVQMLIEEAVLAEREQCCAIVYGLCESDNAAQRIVDAIRKRGQA